VTLSPGTQTVNFALEVDATRLSEVVVTGVTGATEQIKVPFAVARVDTTQMPVAGANPISQLQGKVPGANIVSASGRPGAAPAVILRGPVSINAQGRSQQPLYIVDGIQLQGAPADLNPQDIESVEVVKGAAAASLYGARAGAGVINITTKTGRNAAEGVRFGVRAELGAGDIERELSISKRHFLQQDPATGLFCTTQTSGGSTCASLADLDTEVRRVNSTPGDAALDPVNFRYDGGIARGPAYQELTGLFQVNSWPRTYNVIDQVVTPSAFSNTNVDLRGRVGRTGFYGSLNNFVQQGAFAFLRGYQRNSARLNLDQNFLDDALVLSATTFYSRAQSNGDNQDPNYSFDFPGNGFFRLTRQPAFVNLLARDSLGRLPIRSNVLNQGSQNQNPLYDFQNQSLDTRLQRFNGGVTARYTPITWLTFDGQFGYDRTYGDYSLVRDRGFRTTTPTPSVNNGAVYQGSFDTLTYNTSVGATARQQIGDDLAVRYSTRYLFEQQEFSGLNLFGANLTVPGLRTADAATENFDIGSGQQLIRQIGMFGGVNLEFKERYIFDATVRRDGSSLFGEGNRWATFGRGSVAWIASEEPWWFGGNALSLAKLRAAVGTTGQRPNFSAQYQTFTIGTGGVLNPATLGNPNLRPEIITETEVGADLELFSRAGLNVTYAESDSRDQILPVRAPTASGFGLQWQNIGTLSNKTWELALDVPLVRRTDFDWSSRLIYSSTRSTITELNVPPFFEGLPLQAAGQIYRFAEGERLGTLYGRKFARSCADLPAEFRTQCGGSGSAFQRNDEGYIVWTGQGNALNEGITRNLWRTNLPAAEAPFGARQNWGMPILMRDSAGSPINAPLGNGLPDFRIGLSQNARYKRLTAYVLFDGAFGQDIWNQGYHWSLGDFMTGTQDEAGENVKTAKPIGYWWRRGPGIDGASGVGGFYDNLGPNNYTVEDASYVKIRELNLGFRLGPIGGTGDWTISVVGRNLFTFTDYRGFDPEVGVRGGTINSAALGAVDRYTFPNLRTYTFQLQSAF